MNTVAKARRPSGDGRSFAKLYLDLIESDAWRSASINVRRLIDFLLREHMRHGGAENGKLKAPQAQLKDYGIGSRYIARTIADAEALGLIECKSVHGQPRGEYRRVASTYTLTWLQLHDGRPAPDTWRRYRNADLSPLPVPKSRNLPLKGKVALPLKGRVDGVILPRKGRADSPENLPLKGKVLSRSSYRDRSSITVLSDEDGVLP